MPQAYPAPRRFHNASMDGSEAAPKKRSSSRRKPPFPGAFSEADAGTRTPDPIITSDVLYQLSYVGAPRKDSAASVPAERAG